MTRRRTRADLDREIQHALAESRDKFTILVKNGMLGSTRHVGAFDDRQAAISYAEKEMARTRSFVDYELWTGTAAHPGNFVEHAGRGRQ